MNYQLETQMRMNEAREMRQLTLGEILRDKLKDPQVYIIAGIVGSLINVYGQLLVPWLRGAANPFVAYVNEMVNNPVLFALSTAVAFLFPFCVSTFTAVMTRYKNRRVESVADFPDRKPDPVFVPARMVRSSSSGAYA